MRLLTICWVAWMSLVRLRLTFRTKIKPGCAFALECFFHWSWQEYCKRKNQFCGTLDSKCIRQHHIASLINNCNSFDRKPHLCRLHAPISSLWFGYLLILLSRCYYIVTDECPPMMIALSILFLSKSLDLAQTQNYRNISLQLRVGFGYIVLDDQGQQPIFCDCDSFFW